MIRLLKSDLLKPFLVFALTALIVSGITPTAQASSIGEGEIDQEFEQELLDLATAMEGALIRDDSGAPYSLDLNEVENTLGYIPDEFRDYAELLEGLASNSIVIEKCENEPTIGTQNFLIDQNQCFVDEFVRTFGQTFSISFMTGIVEHVMQGRFVAAARDLGRAGLRATPASIIVQLGIIEVKCLFSH
ncbi:hypothetical protein JCM19046_3378 [Bacillus sp. JCM 19046]|nr:hypothetical protein JCM19045_877 [Bacillus sp. JCM 19045]GAF18782.1 hypothetical protein JCM19046_3378 [Bacillus sp. JCM 19046]